jgi:hypothetical protein
MPGKLSHLKSQLELAQEEPTRQEELNALKEKLQGENVGVIAAQYRELYDQKEKLKEQESKVQLELDARMQLLINHLESFSLNQIRTEDGGTTLYIKDDVRCSLLNRAEFLQWIKDSHQEELLCVHYSTMNAISKNRLEKGQPLPPGIKAFFQQTIGIRRNR